MFTFINNCSAGSGVQFTGPENEAPYAWDFGDGSTSTEMSPKHTFALPGQYTVTLSYATGSAAATVNVVGATATGQTLYMPLELYNDEQYSNIVMRNLASSWPTKMYDSGSYPVRTLKVWPIPQSQYAVELWLWAPLANYETLDDQLNLPPGYERYLRFKLAVEIAAEFGKEVSNTVKMALNEAETSIKRMNQQLPITSGSRAGASLATPRNLGRRG